MLAFLHSDSDGVVRFVDTRCKRVKGVQLNSRIRVSRISYSSEGSLGLPSSRERHLCSGIDYWQDRGEHEEDRETELGRDKEGREGGRLFF